MHCNTCSSDVAARVKVWIDKEGKSWEACDICSKLPAFWNPDVYLGGPGGHEQTDEQLCNPKTGEPIPFSTKREKAAIMNMLGLRQADSAERQHGSRNESHLNTGKKKFFT
jgi:hypothetical protein